MAGKKPANGKRNGNGRKNGKAKISPSVKRPRGAPARKWTAAELAKILDETRSGATKADLAKKHACCRMTLNKLTSRPDFVDAFDGAKKHAILNGEFTMYSEGIGGRETTKTVVETDCEGHVVKRTVTTEIAAPNIGALSRYLAAECPEKWSERATVKHEGDISLFSLLEAGEKEAKKSA